MCCFRSPFEREVISERTRDRDRGCVGRKKWSGGMPVLGTTSWIRSLWRPRTGRGVRQVFQLYLELESLLPVVKELGRRLWPTKQWTTGGVVGPDPFDKRALQPTRNVAYIGKVGTRTRSTLASSRRSWMPTCSPQVRHFCSETDAVAAEPCGTSRVRCARAVAMRGLQVRDGTPTAKAGRQYRYYRRWRLTGWAPPRTG